MKNLKKNREQLLDELVADCHNNILAKEIAVEWFTKLDEEKKDEKDDEAFKKLIVLEQEIKNYKKQMAFFSGLKKETK